VTEAPLTAPGEVAGRPKLVLRYPTDPDRIAALLPPGLEPYGEPAVQIGVYCVPVHGEPEHGVSTRVPARFAGVDGQYTIGIGIDQESAIFVSRETNGQPKFPCSVTYHRLGEQVVARCSHQGRTFLEYTGAIGVGAPEDGLPRAGDELVEDEWWIKVSRAVGGGEGYDLPPRVVRVHSEGVVTHVDAVDGELLLHDSPWDPYTELLPMTGPAIAALVTTRHTARTIAVAGPLDPAAFAPFADTIGGSRWPGERGAPPARLRDTAVGAA
jgi:acetoacetate decarboxylase